MKGMVLRSQRPDGTWARSLVFSGTTLYSTFKKPGVRAFTTNGIRFERDPDQTITPDLEES